MWKRAVADASDDFVSPLTNRKAFRVGIKDKPGDVFSRHHGELLAKERLEVCENDVGSRFAVILDGYYLNHTLS